jgi:hypothetical protein
MLSVSRGNDATVLLGRAVHHKIVSESLGASRASDSAKEVNRLWSRDANPEIVAPENRLRERAG